MSADPEPARHIVGGTTRSAVQAAKRGADSVYRVVDLDPYPTAVAGDFPEVARMELAQRPDVAYVERDVSHEVTG